MNANKEAEPQPDRPQVQKLEGMRKRPFYIIGADYKITQKSTWRNIGLGVTGVVVFSTFAMYASNKYLEQRRKRDTEIYDGVIARQKFLSSSSESKL
ncbi:hypothetical protein LENED_011163 [Lentinula edodes]|uniref:Cytochrome c oxidase assembly factor 3 n=1 Tax=Lentinula edodes TaxID=5353 RepID=A0A1Q3EPB8_LENED|nr:hypothetical protein LENED_011163 [Lentinula edodes]